MRKVVLQHVRRRYVEDVGPRSKEISTEVEDCELPLRQAQGIAAAGRHAAVELAARMPAMVPEPQTQLRKATP